MSLDNVLNKVHFKLQMTDTCSGVDLGGGCRGCTPSPPPEMTCGFLIQLVFCQKKKLCGLLVLKKNLDPPLMFMPMNPPELSLLILKQILLF